METNTCLILVITVCWFRLQYHGLVLIFVADTLVFLKRDKMCCATAHINLFWSHIHANVCENT